MDPSMGILGSNTFTSPEEKPIANENTFPLSHGAQIPVAGHGSLEKGWSFDPAHNARIVTVLSQAIRRGLRLIDTAKIYATEELVGRAVRESDVPRDQITIVTKLWNTDHGRVREAFEESLSKLMLDYVDVYLMHWPCALSDSEDGFTGHPVAPESSPTLIETWRQMETLVGTRCRAIGVSNFTQKTLSEILQNCTIAPVINEIEVHPVYPQTQLVPWCLERGIRVMAWGPLAGGIASDYGEIFQSLYSLPTLQNLAIKYHGNPDDVGALILCWLYSRGIIGIPHSSSVERIVNNLRVFPVSNEDVQIINEVHKELGGLRRLIDGAPVWNEQGPGGRGRTIFGWTVQEMGWEDENGNSLVG